jgi:transposase, IS30 family
VAANRSAITVEERREIGRRAAAGERYADIAAAVGRTDRSVKRVVAANGGIPPRNWERSKHRLSLGEREEISRGLSAGKSLRTIAADLDREPSTIAREVTANGGRDTYRAWAAERRAWLCARRPKVAKLARVPMLRAVVEGWLEARWSPQQIARRLRLDYPDEPEMWVSHETIYQSLFIQARGALRKELTRYLRTGRALRKPHGRVRRPSQPDRIHISERPAEAEDRAVPGHWEGDLVIGKNNLSAIGTLVERSTRYVMLMELADGYDADAVRIALEHHIGRLPEELRRSLTWDRGVEMAGHLAFTVATGVQVYFCDPQSPWQRGTNENTNGLLRQYFPKGTDLSVHTQADLDAVARELNGRPRQTLGWMKPCEKFTELVALTA